MKNKIFKILNIKTKFRIIDIIFFLSIISYIIFAINNNLKFHNIDISTFIYMIFLFILGIFKNFSIGKFGKWLNKVIDIKFKYSIIYIIIVIITLIKIF
jgi:hypothetical protein